MIDIDAAWRCTSEIFGGGHWLWSAVDEHAGSPVRRPHLISIASLFLRLHYHWPGHLRIICVINQWKFGVAIVVQLVTKCWIESNSRVRRAQTAA